MSDEENSSSFDDSVLVVEPEPRQPVPVVDLTADSPVAPQKVSQPKSKFSFFKTPRGSIVVKDDNTPQKETSSTAGAKDVRKSPEFKIGCSVCFESARRIYNNAAKELVSTDCGHIFCSHCLEVCLKHKNECPKCRKKAPKNHTLYP